MKTSNVLLLLAVAGVGLYAMSKSSAAAGAGGYGYPGYGGYPGAGGSPAGGFANQARGLLNQFGGGYGGGTPVGYGGTPVGGGTNPYSQGGSAIQNAAFTGTGSPAFTGAQTAV